MGKDDARGVEEVAGVGGSRKKNGFESGNEQ